MISANLLDPVRNPRVVTAIIVLYTLRGAMRAVAWTDLLQGLVMFTLLLISLIMIVRHQASWRIY